MSGVEVDSFQVERALLNELERIFVREVCEDPQVLQIFSGFALQGIRSLFLGESDLEKEEDILSRLIEARTSVQYGQYLERSLQYKVQTVEELASRKRKVVVERPVIDEIEDPFPQENEAINVSESIESKKEALMTKARVLESLLNSNSYLINSNKQES